MDPQNSPNQNTDQSTRAWFESIDSPNPLPDPSEPNPSGGKWKLVIIVICALLVIGGLAVAAISLTPQPAPIGKCLDNSSYEKFLGVKTEDTVQAKENFYTQSIRFAEGSTDYPAELRAATDNFLKKIGAFYQSQYGESSITISITSDYLEGQSALTAKERTTKLKEALIEYGVAGSAIRTNAPEQITTEDPSAADTPAIISISSHSKCQEVK